MRLAKLWLPVVIWAALILSASNDSFSEAKSRGWLSHIFGEVPYAVNFVVRKAGHVVSYGLLGALAYRADRRIAIALGIVLLVASTDEYRQALTRTRSGSGWDVLLDLSGALMAIIVMHRVRRAAQNRSGGAAGS